MLKRSILPIAVLAIAILAVVWMSRNSPEAPPPQSASVAPSPVAPAQTTAPSAAVSAPPASSTPPVMIPPKLPPVVQSNQAAATGVKTSDATSALPSPLHFAQGPTQGTELVETRIKSLADNPRYAQQLADPSQLQIMPPLGSYNLDLNVLSNGGNLDQAAQLTGYNYVVTIGGQGFAAATVLNAATGRTQQRVSLVVGPDAPNTVTALAQLANLPEMQGGNYEARLLSSSALRLHAIWLKSTSGGPDYVYLISPAPPIEINKLLPVADFVKSIINLYQVRQNGPPGFG